MMKPHPQHNDSSRVLIIDDHPLFRKGASQLLALDARFELVGEAAGGREGAELAIKLQPDLIMLDMNMDDMDGIQTLRAMRRAKVESKIIMLTVSNSERDLVTAIREGADGYLLKDMEPEDILEQLCQALDGQAAISKEMTHLLVHSFREEEPVRNRDQISLTEREEEILTLIAKGMTNKSIARELGITEGTVKVHVKNLLRKLNLHSRLEAAVWALDDNNQKH